MQSLGLGGGSDDRGSSARAIGVSCMNAKAAVARAAITLCLADTANGSVTTVGTVLKPDRPEIHISSKLTPNQDSRRVIGRRGNEQGLLAVGLADGPTPWTNKVHREPEIRRWQPLTTHRLLQVGRYRYQLRSR